jgi:hypothetical protein
VNHELYRGMFTGRRYATMADMRRLLDVLIEHFDDRSERQLTIVVVPELTDLPDEAKATEWFRVVDEPGFIYVGNGAGRRLARFPVTLI